MENNLPYEEKAITDDKNITTKNSIEVLYGTPITVKEFDINSIPLEYNPERVFSLLRNGIHIDKRNN